MDNDLHSLLLRRHSIRRYTPDTIDPEKVKMILEAGLLAPSSKSARPWEFFVTDSREKLEALSRCKAVGSRPLAGCAMAIAVCASPEKSDVWVEDAAAAATLMHLQAAALGLGSCWVQVRLRDDGQGETAANRVREILDIPGELEPLCVLSIGVPDEERRPVDPDKLLWEKVHIVD